MTDYASAHATITAVVPAFNLPAIAEYLATLEGTLAKRVFDALMSKGLPKHFCVEDYNGHLYIEADENILPILLEAGLVQAGPEYEHGVNEIHLDASIEPKQFLQQFEFLMNLDKLSIKYAPRFVSMECTE